MTDHKIVRNLCFFLIDKEIIALSDAYGLITPLEKSNLSGTAYDIRAGDIITSRNHASTFDITKDYYSVESGEVITIRTMEKINFATVLCSGIIANKHSLLAKGFFHPMTTIDPGFNAVLAITFINLGNTRIKISRGDKIAKLFVTPLIKWPNNVYGKTQLPSYREGSLEIASLFENPMKTNDPEILSRMYGAPIKYIYDKMENIERELNIADIKKDYKSRKEFWNTVKNIAYAVISGASGAFLGIYLNNHFRLFEKIIE